MRILFLKTSVDENTSLNELFSEFGITTCYMKELCGDGFSEHVTDKRHHHTEFEIHVIQNGFQCYEADGREYRIEAGMFFWIPPLVKHRLLCSSDSVRKFAFVFHAEERSGMPAETTFENAFAAELPEIVSENIRQIENESKDPKRISRLLIGNRVFESIVAFFRAAGLVEARAVPQTSAADPRLTIAKRYVSDNVELPIKVSELAAHCYMSPKQLTRLFLAKEGVTPSEYIAKARLYRIMELLRGEASLKEISDKMNFPNEYYFNAFFKKNYGMPPGAYRKMIQ